MRYALLLSLLPLNIFAATFSYSGDWRAELALHHDLDLSKSMHGTPSADYLDPSNANFNPNASNDTKTYWLQRFKLKPDLIIYDDVRIKSEWILLAGSALSSTSMGGQPGNMVAGGIMSGDNINANLSIRRAWLDWTSDWGAFTFGGKMGNPILGIIGILFILVYFTGPKGKGRAKNDKKPIFETWKERIFNHVSRNRNRKKTRPFRPR